MDVNVDEEQMQSGDVGPMTLFKPPRLTIGIAPTTEANASRQTSGRPGPGRAPPGGVAESNPAKGAISEVSDRRDEFEDYGYDGICMDRRDR